MPQFGQQHSARSLYTWLTRPHMRSDVSRKAPHPLITIPEPTACACGSGLRRARCCGLDLATLGPPAASHSMPALPADPAAERLCLDALEAAPGQPEALWTLSRLRLAQDKPAAAEALVGRIVALDPNNARATQDLALRVMRRGDATQAEAHARNALRSAPLDPQSHTVLAMVLTEALKPHAAAVHYRRALELSGRRDPILLANFALCLRMQGRMAESRALYQESQAMAPLELQILLDWAKLEEADHQLARAGTLIEEAARLAPGHPSLRLLRAVLQSRQGATPAALATLGPAPGAAALSAEELMEQGRLLDRAGRHDDAFAAFAAARAVMRAADKPQYAGKAASQLASRLCSFFTATRLATLPRATVRADRPQPVFILGFPRSGTTLVEQTLTATPAIAAGGELPLVSEVATVMARLLNSPLTYPDALAELWMSDRSEGLEALRDHYLHRTRLFGIAQDAALFTDKMPLNEMHLGLIALLFPAAPLIHVLRHPLDVVLSVFSNNLSHGFNCSATLETAARHYALVDALVEHYRSQMSLRYLPVRYEDLVRGQERQVRQLLDFVGVPFEPAHLRFHENRRHAPTASYAQVREPLYDRSLERWRHYRKHLAPVIPILRPAIERLGYECD